MFTLLRRQAKVGERMEPQPGFSANPPNRGFIKDPSLPPLQQINKKNNEFSVYQRRHL